MSQLICIVVLKGLCIHPTYILSIFRKKLENKNTEKSVYVFCLTRWTVRGDTLGSLIKNHNELMAVWENGIKSTKDTEMKARMIGAQASMQKFSFLFGCLLGEKLLSQSDILSKTLQSPDLCATEAHHCADTLLKKLKKERSEKDFNNL